MVTYLCSQCQSTYSPMAAARVSFRCHGRLLERCAETGRRGDEETRRRGNGSENGNGNPPSAPGTPQSAIRLVEIVTPRRNETTPAAVETMLQALSRLAQPFSLEILGEPQAVRFLVRAPRTQMPAILGQIEAAYGYSLVETRDYSDRDPGQIREGQTAAQANLVLRGAAYLPIKTWRDEDWEASSPVLGILGSLQGLQEGERVLVQVLMQGAPDDWAVPYKSLTREPNAFDPQAHPQPLKVVGLVAILPVLLLLLIQVSRAWVRGEWLALVISLVVLLAGGIATILWAARLVSEATYDLKLVQEKLMKVAFYTHLRITAIAPQEQAAAARLDRVVTAYRQFNLAAGSGFIAKRATFVPADLSLDGRSVGCRLLTWLRDGRARGETVPWQKSAVATLNVREIASLWHLPQEQYAVPFLERTSARKSLPLSTLLTGIAPVGQAEYQGQAVTVSLPQEALVRNTLVVGKSGKGKSVLAAHLVRNLAGQGGGIVVVDPHSDLVRDVLAHVPASRRQDVVWLDLSDTAHPVGLNLLDTAQGRRRDKTTSDILRSFQLIWADNWGPRMESMLRYALLALLEANEGRRPEQQFTLLHVSPLLVDVDFRHRLLTAEVKDPETLRFFFQEYAAMDNRFRHEVITPVLTKMGRFSSSQVARHIVGQARSTVRLPEVLAKGQILLVNTAAGVVGDDVASLLGATILDLLDTSLRERGEKALAERRSTERQVTVVVDEFQTLLGVNYVGLLGGLRKFGANFVLLTQSLSYLDKTQPGLRQGVFSNVDSLVAFQTSADDAYVLEPEMGMAMERTDLVNLPDYTCYVRTVQGGQRVPPFSMTVLPPLQNDTDLASEIVAVSRERYARPGDVVAQEISAVLLEVFPQAEEIRKVNDAAAARREAQRAGVAVSPEALFAGQDLRRVTAAVPAARSRQRGRGGTKTPASSSQQMHLTND